MLGTVTRFEGQKAIISCKDTGAEYPYRLGQDRKYSDIREDHFVIFKAKGPLATDVMVLHATAR